MNFNFSNQIDFEKELQKKIGMDQDDLDQDLDDLINDDPELKDFIKKSEKKNKNFLDEDIQLDDLSLEDLESKEGEVKETKDKELDDLLCEEDTQYKQKKEEEILRKKTSQLQESLRMSTLKGFDTKNNLTEANKSSQINFNPNDNNKPGKEINSSQSKISIQGGINPDKTSVSNDVNPSISKTDPKRNIVTSTNSELDKEFYDEKVEKFFHSVDKMKSIGVLQEESALMDYIIKFNTKNNLDSDEFDNKKFFIQNQIDKINLLVESGEMDLKEYKKTIGNQLEFEKFLITKVDTEDKIKNKNFVKRRIEKRIQIILNELNEDIQEESEDVNHPVPKQEVIKSATETEQNFNPTERKDFEENKTVKSPQTIIESNLTANDVGNSTKPKEIQIKNQKIYDEITSRADEYRKAVEYFINIESLKQAENARSKVSILTKALESMEHGKTVSEIDLPIAITPDYICNMTKQERLNNFSIIIKDFSRKKNDINAQVKKAIDGYNKLDPRTQSQLKVQFTESLKAKKTKLDNFTGIINKLMEMVKNPWIPAPLFVEKEEEEKVEKINEDIGDHEMQIKIGKLTHGIQSAYLRLIFEVSKDKILTSLVNKNEASSDFQYSTILKLEKNACKYLHRKNFRLVLVERTGFCCFKKEIEFGESLIKLDSLKSSSYFDGEFQFKTAENIASDSKIFVSVKIRQPTIEKEYINVSKTGISITKTFPPFKGDNVVEIIDEEEKPKKINENVKLVKKPEPKVDKEFKPVSKKGNLPKKDGPTKAEVEYKMSDFKREELENPDIIENLTSVKVLIFKISRVEEEIKKIEGRAPPKLREKLIKMKVTKNNLEAQMGGEITINMYLGMLRYQLDHDRKLAKYFQDKNEIEKVKLVAERIPILISEIEEAVDYMTKNKS